MGNAKYQDLADDLGLSCAVVRDGVENYFQDNQAWLCDRGNHSKWNAVRVDRLIATKTIATDKWLSKAVELGPLSSSVTTQPASTLKTTTFQMRQGTSGFTTMAKYQDMADDLGLSCAVVRDVVENYFQDNQQWLCERGNHSKWNAVRVDRLIATKTIATDKWLSKAVELGYVPRHVVQEIGKDNVNVQQTIILRGDNTAGTNTQNNDFPNATRDLRIHYDAIRDQIESAARVDWDIPQA
ncbi:hypothetical protein FN846DRAFT_908524 [Sphaerosporella brunnea]|uniref:Uncharacterized protein n=1 Tax=Sphaerosporella brunnea TaxID=1250544 RepID=A0A5J5ETC3_9PEZI|nr:hypothetical protein FN846DRAFT_908524 [Sphaerosporella brunnea]